jgi:hypothetical protein
VTVILNGCVKKGHHCSSKIDTFLNGGNRCATCSRANNAGKYLHRLEDRDTLYLLSLSLEDERFIKIGRSFNLSSRIHTLNSTSPYFIEILDTYSGSHADIFEKEQSWHFKLRHFHYKPKYNFGGSVLECFSVKSLEVVNYLGLSYKN